MASDPLNLSKRDICDIISYVRKMRTAAEGGYKPKKSTPAPSAPELIRLGLKKPSLPMKRRKMEL